MSNYISGILLLQSSCFQVLRVLPNISRQLNDCTVTTTVDDMQGTKYLLRNKNISNANNFTSISNGDKGECRKDIGELTTLYRRNRGIEAVVAGGGIILSWTPLYKSEGPT